MRSRRSPLVLALALVLAPLALVALPRVARAQEEPPPPPDKEADWQEAFQRGLDLLRDRKMDKSIEAFETCRKLVPNREEMILDYNIACAYAQKKDPAKACEFLKRSFDGGFLDLEHVGEDSDLDPIRDAPAFKKLVEETRKKVLDTRPKAQRIVPKSAPAKGRALVVYLGGNGAAPSETAQKIAPVAEAVGCVVLVPSGRSVDGEGHAGWDSAAETCIIADVREALADPTLAIDPERVVVAGELEGARLAVEVGLAHGWRKIVAAAGVYQMPPVAQAAGSRVYLLAPVLSERAVQEATNVRDAVLAAGGHAVVERTTGEQIFPVDFAGTLERAVRWALGEKVKLPDTGETHRY